MRERGLRWLGIGAVLTVLAALWWGARLGGHVEGPDERLAEYLTLPLPLIFLGFGLLETGAAHNNELPSSIPEQLPIRLTTRANDPGLGRTWLFVWWSALVWGCAFALVVALYPRTWSDSWVCSACENGETCCDLVDENFVSSSLFVIVSIFGSTYALFGLALGFMATRGLVSRHRLPRPIVEVSAERVAPGGRLAACVQLLGKGRCKVVRLELVCEEIAEHSVGSSTSTDKEIVYREVLIERHNERLLGSLPLVLRADTQLPITAMHSFKARTNEIRWRLVLDVSASIDVEESFEIEVPATP
jgi:hypothetical protein